MTAELGRQPLPVAPAHRASLVGRAFGLGSVFGKTLRDSRRAMVIVAGFLALLWVVIGTATASTFRTVETRAEGISITTTLPPILLGLYGGTQPNVVTLGGFANWRYGEIFFLVPGVWSLLALSATLVTEARRGSLDVVAAAPLARRRIALEKLGGHVAAMAVAMALIGGVAWAVGAAFGTLTPDEIASLGGSGTDQIPLTDALSYSLVMGLVGLTAGSIAFACAPFVGRGASAGIAALVLAGSWVIFGYRESIAVFDTLLQLSWFAWAAGHRPIAGTYDWFSLIPLLGILAVASAVGTVAFERRDIGAIGSVRTPGMPTALRGIGGPFGRSLSERVTGAVWWGIGIGLIAFLVASSGDELRDSIAQAPAIREMFEALFPAMDLNAPGFGLQLAFLVFGYLGAALAAATILGGWASDESEGRLEMVLATATARARWFVLSGIGVYAAVVVVAAVVALFIALGVATTGDDPLTPAIGAAVLAMYGAAAAGCGLAFSGWVRSGIAMPAAVVIAVATILVDILVPALRLPDWVRDVALTAHFGEPMVGSWDPVGIGVSLALAAGGLAIGAVGFARRDLRG